MILTLTLLLLSSAVPASAANAPSLTLADCLRLAREHSTTLESARLVEAGAHGSADEASAALKPQLLAVGQLTRSDDPATNLPNDNNGVLRLQQSLSPLSPAWADARRARADLAAAGLSRRDAWLAEELQVKTFYYAILRDEAAVRSVDLVSARTRDLLNAVLPRFSVGSAPPFDLVKVRSTLADLEKTRADILTQLAGEKSRLAQDLGMADDTPLALAPIEEAAPSLPVSRAAAIEASPAFGALAHRVDSADLALTVARRARWPTLLGGAEYGYSGYTTSGMTRGWSLSLGLGVPVFDWGRIGASVRIREAAAGQARSDLEALRRETRAVAIETFASARAHAADRDRMKALAAEAQEAALAGVARYRRGAAGILEATDALGLWLSTNLGENTAAYAYLTDLARLERLSPPINGNPP